MRSLFPFKYVFHVCFQFVFIQHHPWLRRPSSTQLARCASVFHLQQLPWSNRFTGHVDGRAHGQLGFHGPEERFWAACSCGDYAVRGRGSGRLPRLCCLWCPDEHFHRFAGTRCFLGRSQKSHRTVLIQEYWQFFSREFFGFHADSSDSKGKLKFLDFGNKKLRRQGECPPDPLGTAKILTPFLADFWHLFFWFPWDPPSLGGGPPVLKRSLAWFCWTASVSVEFFLFLD